MKLIILLILTLNFQQVFAQRVGHGGDPSLIQIEKFENENALDEALLLAEDALLHSLYNHLFNQAMLKELKDLKENKDRIKYVDQFFTLFPHNSRYKTIVNVGALAQIETKTIYLSKKTQKYTSKKLSQVILQEIIHFVLPRNLQQNEDLLNELGASIAKGDEVILKIERILDAIYSLKNTNDLSTIIYCKNGSSGVVLTYFDKENNSQFSNIEMKKKFWNHFLGISPDKDSYFFRYSKRGDYQIYLDVFHYINNDVILSNNNHTNAFAGLYKSNNNKEFGHIIYNYTQLNWNPFKQNLLTTYKLFRTKNYGELKLKIKEQGESNLEPNILTCDYVTLFEW